MFLTRRFFILAALVTLTVGAGYWYAPLFGVGRALLCLLGLAWLCEHVLLWHRRGVEAERICPERLSNGDDNDIEIHITSHESFAVWLEVIDELPVEFQRRDMVLHTRLSRSAEHTLRYTLRPVCRGAYRFGHIRVFATTVLGLVQRRYTLGTPQEVKVYPSFQMLRRYELLAISNRLTEMGIKHIRRAGNHTDFEQIKDYVKGDEYRSINWKASARRAQLMVNLYNQERAQQVYHVIDKGRMMQQTFEGMTYLDYAINAALVLSYVVMHKEDKAGVITFNQNLDTLIPASRQNGHMETILEALYRQHTDFGETDFSALVAHVGTKVSQRSLMVVYTNFATLEAMCRQLPYLRQLARRHRVLVVFFEDAELKAYLETSAHSAEEYYRHVVTEKFVAEQRLIVSTLQRHGLMALLTTPQGLSVDVINKYLELKARHLLG